MVRAITDTNERKQPVSMSLTALEIVMLNNLSKELNMNRSRVIAAMIRDHSFKEMGLSAIEVHKQPVQHWHPRTVFRANYKAPGACNPHHTDGKCTHPHCVKLYSEWGV